MIHAAAGQSIPDLWPVVQTWRLASSTSWRRRFRSTLSRRLISLRAASSCFSCRLPLWSGCLPMALRQSSPPSEAHSWLAQIPIEKAQAAGQRPAPSGEDGRGNWFPPYSSGTKSAKSMDKVIEAIGSLTPVHMQFSKSYSERFARLTVKDKQLSGVQTGSGSAHSARAHQGGQAGKNR